MQLNAIVAMSENRVIGYQNRLPWHLPADLRHFKQITMGKPILMGRKTYESIGRPLPGRENIILTRQQDFKAAGCVVVHDIQEAFHQRDELFLIGGADLFQQLLPKVQQIYLTVIHRDFEGDAFFPELIAAEWNEVENKNHPPDADNPYAYTFKVLIRRNGK